MALITPAFLQNGAVKMTDAKPSRVVPFSLEVDLGGINPAIGDIIQLTPYFLDGEAIRQLRIVKLAVSLDSGILAATDEIILARQVLTGTPTEQMQLKAAANGNALVENTLEEAVGSPAGQPLQFRVWSGPVFVGLKYTTNINAIASGKKARVAMAYTKGENSAVTTETFV